MDLGGPLRDRVRSPESSPANDHRGRWTYTESPPMRIGLLSSWSTAPVCLAPLNSVPSATTRFGSRGTFYGVSRKHLQRYLDEFVYRFDRRWREGELFGFVLNRVAHGGPLPCQRLLAVAFGYAGGRNTVMAPDRGGGRRGTGPRAARKLFLRGKG